MTPDVLNGIFWCPAADLGRFFLGQLREHFAGDRIEGRASLRRFCSNCLGFCSNCLKYWSRDTSASHRRTCGARLRKSALAAELHVRKELQRTSPDSE